MCHGGGKIYMPVNMNLRVCLSLLPRRKEYLGGQEFSYVKLDDVLAVLDTEGDRQEPSACRPVGCPAVLYEDVPVRWHSRISKAFFEGLAAHERLADTEGDPPTPPQEK
jgi:hypothetical protein